MKHVDLTDLIGALSAAVDSAGQNLTRPSVGDVYRNGDGSKTIIGGGTPTGVTQWVGDTTAPGRPIGITATSRNGAVWVTWDGTLDGGIPTDFSHVQFTLADDGRTIDLGSLAKAGTLTVASLTPDDVVIITATAYDDAHDDTGKSTPNASTPSDPVQVTVASAVDPETVERAQQDAQTALNQAGQAAQNVVPQYAVSGSDTDPPDTGWSTDTPRPLANQYTWMRTVTTHGDKTTTTSAPVRTTGNSAILIDIHATRGIAFHNNDIDTTLRLTVLCGARRVTTLDELHAVLGSSAYIQWTALTGSARTPVIISNSDPMVTDDGFSLTLSPDNVDVSVTFTADVMS
ncbi:hypothetical protein [Bifidobacterium mongoliense]|uniref:Prophage protein n=1 Tax=Bifidobacterium mongoliense DSM 21395 TaxID=1437603 RepID=A0A087BZT2_9BIFI|nr:hypothetical protein [Bifidobacterium mongoliense]KFI76532.1 prophage protein [Bifidobacterium mongoliense DSM 21395]